MHGGHGGGAALLWLLLGCSAPPLASLRAGARLGGAPRLSASSAASSSFGAEVIRLEPGSSTYLVGALIKRERYRTLSDSWTIDDSLDELQRLCETADLNVLGRQYQTMQHPSPATFIGPGKLEEIAATVGRLRIRTVVFDDELSPAQGRNIADALGGAQVIDRTMLILFIFAQRARTREAKLQVSAAQFKYMLPRLSSFLSVGAGLDAKGGGGSGGGQFLKGSGESQLEVDRRLFRKQLERIEEQIAAVQAQRDAYREKRRQREMLPVVAIVGYTNAGKSTLLNALVGKSEVRLSASDPKVGNRACVPVCVDCCSNHCLPTGALVAASATHGRRSTPTTCSSPLSTRRRVSSRCRAGVRCSPPTRSASFRSCRPS